MEVGGISLNSSHGSDAMRLKMVGQDYVRKFRDFPSVAKGSSRPLGAKS